MNARLYDPVLGRFLSPDRYVADPLYSQDYNRYMYARNNPLTYTDPDGELIHLIVGAIIGGTFNLIANWKNVDNFWQGLGYFGVGAAAGALGAGIGAGVSSSLAGGSFGAGFWGTSTAMTATSSFGTSLIIGGTSGFTSGFTTGFGNGLMGGQSFGQALGNGLQSGFITGVSSAVGAAAFQGMNNLFERDFSFANGRVTVEKPLKILPTNTLNYMAGSTASQVTTNLLTGRKPFQGVDYGFNLGILFPLTVDVLTYSQRYNMNRAQKHHPDLEITGIGNSQTTLVANGDLRLDQNLYFQEYLPNNFKIEMMKYLDVDTYFLAGQPRVISDMWVHSMFIPNYRDMIYSIFNSLSLKRRK